MRGRGGTPLRPARAFALAILLAAPLALVAQPAAATAPPSVDAGVSFATPAGAPFGLDGKAEGFASTPALTWTAPAGCTLDDPHAALPIASCAAGTQVFSLAATDGIATATDTVAIQVLGETVAVVVNETRFLPRGTAAATAPVGDAAGSGQLASTDAASWNFQVQTSTRLDATLSWGSRGSALPDGRGDDALENDLDLRLREENRQVAAAATTANPETLSAILPTGTYTLAVQGRVAHNVEWRLLATMTRPEKADLPAVTAPGAVVAPGTLVTLSATGSGGQPPYTFAWEAEGLSRRFDDGTGPAFTFTASETTLVRVRVTDARGFETESASLVRMAGTLARPVTVVGVLDGSFSPYHEDFLARTHPWNTDADPTNDVTFLDPPQTLVAGMPAATPLPITLPPAGSTNVNTLRTEDAATWAQMQTSTASNPRLYWIPGTKVVGAMKWSSGNFQDTNAAHGTASASVAVGNIHGACPECLVVMLGGINDAALAWAASQPWIDVLTNSYGSGSLLQTGTLGFTRDNAYWNAPVDATKAGTLDGQVIVFSAGNGFLNAFDVPMFTYWSSQKGPDWMVTVGAVTPSSKQTYTGAGKPVDISSIGSDYPSSGGSTANGVGSHGGTSNAAPVTAGTFAKVLQRSREILGDNTSGHAAGVVASGPPVACGLAVPTCALGDGVLTRAELQELVFKNVLPSTQRIVAGTVPTESHAYYYMGHGVIRGRIDGQAAYEAEWGRMVDNALGHNAALPRPEAEENWFIIDSKCRQHLWGAWSEGYYRGEEPTLDPDRDDLATRFDSICRELPERPFTTGPLAFL